VKLGDDTCFRADVIDQRGLCRGREAGPVLPLWQEKIFAAMVRNASHVTDYFRLPSEQVVEIGRQISI